MRKPSWWLLVSRCLVWFFTLMYSFKKYYKSGFISQEAISGFSFTELSQWHSGEFNKASFNWKIADKHRTKRKGTWCYWDLFVYLSYVLLDGNQSSTKRNLSQQVAFRVILTKHNCLHLNISVPMTAGVVSLCCLNDVTLTHLDEMKCILSFLLFLYGENYFTAGIQTVNLLIP